MVPAVLGRVLAALGMVMAALRMVMAAFGMGMAALGMVMVAFGMVMAALGMVNGHGCPRYFFSRPAIPWRGGMSQDCSPSSLARVTSNNSLHNG